MHLRSLGLEAIRKNSSEVGYAGIVLVVKLLETDKELDLSQNDVSFIFDKLDNLAQHEAHKYAYLNNNRVQWLILF